MVAANAVDREIALPDLESDHGEQGQAGEPERRVGAIAPGSGQRRLVGASAVRRRTGGRGVATCARLKQVGGAHQLAGQIGVDQITENFSMALAHSEEVAAEATVSWST